jgi:hypothetical protein
MLEFSAGSARTNMARSIFSAVDNLYDPYAYTQPLSDGLHVAVAEMADFKRILHKTLHTNQDVHTQGFRHALSTHSIVGKKTLTELLQKR